MNSKMETVLRYVVMESWYKINSFVMIMIHIILMDAQITVKFNNILIVRMPLTHHKPSLIISHHPTQRLRSVALLLLVFNINILSNQRAKIVFSHISLLNLN